MIIIRGNNLQVQQADTLSFFFHFFPGVPNQTSLLLGAPLPVNKQSKPETTHRSVRAVKSIFEEEE
jgi:hypothetical protein